MVQAKLTQLVLEVALVAHSEVEAGEVLGHLEDSVPPVVCSLHILGVVNGVVGDNEWFLEKKKKCQKTINPSRAETYFELLAVVGSPVAADAVLVVSNPGGQGSLVVSTSGVAHGGLLELVGEVLRSVEDDALLLAQLSHDGILTGVSEHVALPQLVRRLREGLHDGGVCSTESEDNDFTLGQYGVGLGGSLDLLGGRSDLAPHVLGDPGGLPGPVVVGGQLSALEDLQRGIAANLEPPAGVFSCFRAVNLTKSTDNNTSRRHKLQHNQYNIYLDQVNRRIVGKKTSCCLFKLWF